MMIRESKVENGEKFRNNEGKKKIPEAKSENKVYNRKVDECPKGIRKIKREEKPAGYIGQKLRKKNKQEIEDQSKPKQHNQQEPQNPPPIFNIQPHAPSRNSFAITMINNPNKTQSEISLQPKIIFSEPPQSLVQSSSREYHHSRHKNSRKRPPDEPQPETDRTNNQSRTDDSTSPNTRKEIFTLINENQKNFEKKNTRQSSKNKRKSRNLSDDKNLTTNTTPITTNTPTPTTT